MRITVIRRERNKKTGPTNVLRPLARSALGSLYEVRNEPQRPGRGHVALKWSSSIGEYRWPMPTSRAMAQRIWSSTSKNCAHDSAYGSSRACNDDGDRAAGLALVALRQADFVHHVY